MTSKKPVAPLASRNGVAPSRVWCPPGPWSLLIEFLLERFPHVPRADLERRLGCGDIVAEDGQTLHLHSVYQPQRWLWYFREVAAEVAVPFELTILHEDHALIAVDKPHFLATTPGGQYLYETALTRVRQCFDDVQIAPLHRLDRETAGVLLFSRSIPYRGVYQQLFQQGAIYKCYEAIAPVTSTLALPFTQTSRIEPVPNKFVMQQVAGLPNSCTHIRLRQQWQDEQGQCWGHYALEPETGRKHQLRIHLSSLGIPIVNDKFYPVLQAPVAADDFSAPLQLLARRIAFTDPITGQRRQFDSQRRLACLPLT